MKNILWQTALLLLLAVAGDAQDVYPGNWWTDMKDASLQLMLHEKNIASLAPVMNAYPGVALRSVTKTSNPNYLFLNLLIGHQAKPGTLRFAFGRGSGHREIRFPLLKRTGSNGN